MMRAIACALARATVPLLVAAAPTPRVHSIVIDKLKFGPAPAQLRAGDTILRVTKDLFRHTATARDARFTLHLPAGKRGRTVLTPPGTIASHSTYPTGTPGQRRSGGACCRANADEKGLT